MPQLYAMRQASLVLMAVMGIGAGVARAQQPASPPGPPATAAPPAGDLYTYQPEGRRDPFLSILGTGSEPRLTSRRGDGPVGTLTDELSVRGIMQNGSALIALVQGPDKKTYLVRAGDKLLDGTVKAVTPEGLTIVQDVSDPLSLVKTREVRKLLRSVEDAK